MDDVIRGAVAFFEIDEGQTVVDLAGIPVAPGQSDRLGPDVMELADKSDRLKEFYRVGADVDAGAELGELGGLLVDFHLETLAAQRNGCRQAAEARSDNSNTTCLSHLMLRDQNDSREGLTWPSLALNRPVTVGTRAKPKSVLGQTRA